MSPAKSSQAIRGCGPWIAGLPLWLCLLSPCPLPASDHDRDSAVLFVRRIAPLLQEKCVACHGHDPQNIEGGLDLTQAETAFRGGDSQMPPIVAGQPQSSGLLLAASRDHQQWSPMPPKEAERLSPQQLEWLREWIASGAQWPDRQRQSELAAAHAETWSAEDGIEVNTSGGLSEQWTHRRYEVDKLWAYQPLRQPAFPAAAAHAAPTPHPIDAFLAAKAPADLAVAPPADPHTLIRRLSLDLTGLPPTPDEIDRFEQAWRISPEQAYLDLVEHLLASPHYGERMAQHWLDVTRYADSSGLANDFERGNAWRYRDYVVRAFNEDKPYDQFVREQIAGDEYDPNDPELIVATGFLRMGPWELTGMEVAKVARQRFLDDVTNAVGETFLAQALQCCRCHDHKFDPIPTRDYYAVQAVFATTQLADRPAAFLACENTTGFEEVRYLHARRQNYVRDLQRLDQFQLEQAQLWFQDHQLSPAAWNAAVAQAQSQVGNGDAAGEDFKSLFAAARSGLAKQGVAEDQYPPKLLGFTPQHFGEERVARKGLQRLEWELARYQPRALAVYNGLTPSVKSIATPQGIPKNHLEQGELEASCILIGGDPFSRGPAVEPGVLSAVAGPTPPQLPQTIDGRRRALAEWIADDRNPLTTRTIANRIWMWHFGSALAGNPNNFGSTGKPPTHPELLDWLAATLVEQGWSLKQLHRLIVTSAAYRRSSDHPQPEELARLDPLGQSYAVFHPRRLSAEELRDAMLLASGELNRQLGGIPNRPEINLEVALQPRQVMGTFAAAWVPNPLPQQRHRRSLYALKLRGLPIPEMEVFNQPAPDFSCERRETSNITPQVFSLFNSQASFARSLALAHRARQAAKDDDEALRLCFAWALGRPPSAAELTRCREHWQNISRMLASEPAPRRMPPDRVTRQAVEENTGERFEFDEQLHAMADFVPDLQPADVPLATRSLADVCLALFNSNEFCYVY